MNNLLSTLYPIGSIYIGTQNSCPLATLIAGSQWQKVATQVVTNVNTGVAVYGNGKGLGLTNSQENFTAYLSNRANINGANQFGQNVGAGATPKYSGVGDKVLGVTRDAANSGLTGSLSRTNLSLNIWKRTA